MKSNKPTTIILLLLSIGIWCTVAYRIYMALQKDRVPTPFVAKVADGTKRDTVRLLLNYKDPFLGGYLPVKDKVVAQKTQPISNKQIVPVQPNPQKELIPDFQYKGILRFGKKIQILLNRNGESIMLKPKEKIGEFFVAEVTDEKLIVTHKGKKYDLQRQ